MSKALLEPSKHREATSLPEIVIYASAGYFAFGPPLADVEALKEDVQWGGGDVEALQQARSNAWTSVVAFLKKSLPTASH
jgi:hypothetical protein